MKKLLTILTVVFTLALITTSCTEEEVKPTDCTVCNGGGGASAEKP